MATAWKASDVEDDVAKWVREKLSMDKVAAEAALADYKSNDFGLAAKQRILCVLRDMDASAGQQWSVSEVHELTYTQLDDMVGQAIEHVTDWRLVKAFVLLDAWRKAAGQKFPDSEKLGVRGMQKLESLLWDPADSFVSNVAGEQIPNACFTHSGQPAGLLLPTPAALVFYVGPSLLLYSGTGLGTKVEKMATEGVRSTGLQVGILAYLQTKVQAVSRSMVSVSSDGGGSGGSGGVAGATVVIDAGFAPVSTGPQVPCSAVVSASVSRELEARGELMARRRFVYEQRLKAHVASKALWSSVSTPITGVVDVAERLGASKALLARAKRHRDGANNDLARAKKALRKAENEFTKQSNACDAATIEFNTIAACAAGARDELRRRLVKPHPSRFSSSSSEVVSIED